MSIRSEVVQLGVGQTQYPTTPQLAAGFLGRVALIMMSGDPTETVCISFDGHTDHIRLRRSGGLGRFSTADSYRDVWLRGESPLLTAATVQVVVETSDE